MRLELIVPEHMRGIEAVPVTIPAGTSQAKFAIKLAGQRPGPFNMPLILRATLTGKEGPTIAETRVEIALR